MGSVLALEFHENLLQCTPQKKRRERNRVWMSRKAKYWRSRISLRQRKQHLRETNRKPNIRKWENETQGETLTSTGSDSLTIDRGNPRVTPHKRKRKTLKKSGDSIEILVPKTLMVDIPVNHSEGYPSTMKRKRTAKALQRQLPCRERNLLSQFKGLKLKANQNEHLIFFRIVCE